MDVHKDVAFMSDVYCCSTRTLFAQSLFQFPTVVPIALMYFSIEVLYETLESIKRTSSKATLLDKLQQEREHIYSSETLE